MSRNPVIRLAAFVVFLAALRLAGLITFDLPWGDTGFQVTGATTLLYLAWALAGPRGSSAAGGTGGTAGMALYAVLLVSAVDGLLLRLTPIPGPGWIRWAGPAAFAAGAALGIARREGSPKAALALRLCGLAAGFDSMAGLAVAAIALAAGARAHDAGGSPDAGGSADGPGGSGA